MSPHQNRPSRRVYPLAPRSGIHEAQCRNPGNGRPDFTHAHRNIRSKFHPVASRLQSSPNGRTARGPPLPAASSGAVPRTAIFRRREPFGPSCFLPRPSLRRASAPHTAKPRRHAQRISPRQSHIQRTAGKSGPPHPTIVARNSPTRHRRNASLRQEFGGPFECVRADTHHPGRIEPQHSAVRSRTTDRLTNRGQIIAVTGTGTFQKKRGHSVHPLLRTGPNTSARSGKQCIHRPDTPPHSPFRPSLAPSPHDPRAEIRPSPIRFQSIPETVTDIETPTSQPCPGLSVVDRPSTPVRLPPSLYEFRTVPRKYLYLCRSIKQP